MRAQYQVSSVTGGRWLGTWRGVTGRTAPSSRSPTTNENTNQGVCPMRRSVITTGWPSRAGSESAAVAVSTSPSS